MSSAADVDEDPIFLDDDGVVADSPLTPRDIFTHLRRVVLGQDAAITSFATAAWRHHHGLPQGPILISGPTGTGKTLLAKTYAQHCDVPLVHVASSSLVADGIKGMTVGSALVALYHAANRNYNRARKGILIIDELDKLVDTNFYGSSIQTSLLTLADGTPWRSFEDAKSSGFDRDSFATDRLLIILIGSFSAIREERGNGLGFTSAPLSSLPDTLDDLIPLADLRGRIDTHVRITPHTRASLLDILESDGGPMQRIRDAVPQWRISLGDDLRERLLSSALASGLGARSLRSQIAAASESLIFDPPHIPGVYDGFLVEERLP